MIESIMYFGIGFLVATLIALAIIPLVHSRAVRLTVRRLEDSIPQSLAEIQADKDALRAEFAMSTRRLEITIDELKTEHTNQLAELGKKGDAVNRLQIEREAQNVEAAALKAEVVAVNERLIAAGKEIEAVRSRSHTKERGRPSGGSRRSAGCYPCQRQNRRTPTSQPGKRIQHFLRCPRMTRNLHNQHLSPNQRPALPQFLRNLARSLLL
jgi:hypothetical protein